MSIHPVQSAPAAPPISDRLLWAEETMVEGPGNAPTSASYGSVMVVQRSSREGAFGTGTGVWPQGPTGRAFVPGTGTWSFVPVSGKSVYTTGSLLGSRNVGTGDISTWRVPAVEHRTDAQWFPDWRDLLYGCDVRVRQTVDSSVTEFQFGVAGGNGLVGLLGTNYGAVLASRSNLDAGRFHIRARKTEGGAELPIGPDLGVGLVTGRWHLLGLRYSMRTGTLRFLLDGVAIAELLRGGPVLPFVPTVTLNPVVGFGFGPGAAANDRVIQVGGHRAFIVAESDPVYA